MVAMVLLLGAVLFAPDVPVPWKLGTVVVFGILTFHRRG